MASNNNIFSHRKEIRYWIDTHRDEIVNTLKELVCIPSFRGEASDCAPFGKACAELQNAVEKLYHDHGFETESDTEGGFLLAYYGNSDKTLGLFAHGDVVAPGEGWIYTEPFKPIEKDGFLIGRGVLDDKSAIVISLSCARILRDLNLPFKSKLLCFTGLNEESGMQDINAYRKIHTPPDFSLVSDTAFPLYRGNKGGLYLTVKTDETFCDILDFHGGSAANVTLGKAEAVLKYSKELFDWLKENEQPDIGVSLRDNTILLEAVGISLHSALPQGSKNAGGMIASLLSDCRYIASSDREKLSFVSSLLGEYNGTVLGIANNDSVFGPLTCTNGIIRMNDGRLSLNINIRFGNSTCTEKLKRNIDKVIGNNGWHVRYEREVNPHLMPEDDEFIKACMDVYGEFTENRNAKPYVNAGGTYAIHLPKSAEIGTQFGSPIPFKLPPGHGHVHQPDECISIDGMLKAIEVTMLMLMACDNILLEKK